MKKKEPSKKKTDSTKKQSQKSDFADLGLEPPKIYRQSQQRLVESQSKKSQPKRQNKKDNLTRSEKRERETKKRKKKNLFRKIIIWICVILAFLAVGTVLSLTVFFHINNVTVSGNSLYSKEEILSQCTIDKGENLFMSDTDKAKQTLEKNLPYIYTAEIKRKLPDTIEIKIKEAKPAYSVNCEDKTYILLDDNFKVLELGAQKSQGIKISKAKIKSSIAGETVVFSNADVGDCLKQIAQTVKENNFTEITAIYSNNISDNYVVYDNRISFKLGNCDNLEKKIYQGLAACEQLDESSPNVSGTMTISGDKSIYFTEE